MSSPRTANCRGSLERGVDVVVVGVRDEPTLPEEQPVFVGDAALLGRETGERSELQVLFTTKPRSKRSPRNSSKASQISRKSSRVRPLGDEAGAEEALLRRLHVVLHDPGRRSELLGELPRLFDALVLGPARRGAPLAQMSGKYSGA